MLLVMLLKMLTRTRKTVTRIVILPGTLSGGTRKLKENIEKDKEYENDKQKDKDEEIKNEEDCDDQDCHTCTLSGGTRKLKENIKKDKEYGKRQTKRMKR